MHTDIEIDINSGLSRGMVSARQAPISLSMGPISQSRCSYLSASAFVQGYLSSFLTNVAPNDKERRRVIRAYDAMSNSRLLLRTICDLTLLLFI